MVADRFPDDPHGRRRDPAPIGTLPRFPPLPKSLRRKGADGSVERTRGAPSTRPLVMKRPVGTGSPPAAVSMAPCAGRGAGSSDQPNGVTRFVVSTLFMSTLIVTCVDTSRCWESSRVPS